MPIATHSAFIQATVEEAMSVISDFESYPTFLPEMKEARIVARGENTWEVEFVIQIIRRLKYTLLLEQSAPSALSWTLKSGSFKVNNGAWSLAEEGEGVKAEYQIDLQIGHFVPGNIVRSLVDKTLPETVSRFKSEIERRFPR